jgi:hypothetical protein
VEGMLGYVADVITRMLENLVGRVTGPMQFRLILQPLMATIFAVRAGVHDARSGRAAYLWSIFTTPGHRRERLREGWKDVGRVFLLAIVIDVVYQIVELRWVYPGETLIVAVILAFLPYLLVRGLATRTARALGAAENR